MRRVGVAASLFALVMSLGASAFAQLRVDWRGRLEARLALESTGAWTAAGVTADLVLDGEVGDEFFPSGTFRAELRADADAASQDATVRLGEAWARLYLGDAEVTLGSQRVFWGSTDGVNPVDRLNPRDLSVPPNAEKMPVPMLHVRAWLDGDVDVEAALIPVFVPSTPPGEAWRESAAFAPPPGTTVTEILPVREERPDATLASSQAGLRVAWRPAGFDLAASYQSLYRDVPTGSAEILPTDTPGEVIVQPVARYERLHVFGASGSVAFGPVVLRGEAAYLLTDDPSGTDPAIGNPSIQAVVGAEMPIEGGPRVIAQIVLDGETRDATAMGEPAGIETGIRTMLMATYAANARTDLDGAWVHDVDGSGLLRPGVAHTFADGVTGRLEGLIAYGPDGTRFGVWRERSGATMSLRIDF